MSPNNLDLGREQKPTLFDIPEIHEAVPVDSEAIAAAAELQGNPYSTRDLAKQLRDEAEIAAAEAARVKAADLKLGELADSQKNTTAASAVIAAAKRQATRRHPSAGSIFEKTDSTKDEFAEEDPELAQVDTAEKIRILRDRHTKPDSRGGQVIQFVPRNIR